MPPAPRACASLRRAPPIRVYVCLPNDVHTCLGRRGGHLSIAHRRVACGRRFACGQAPSSPTWSEDSASSAHVHALPLSRLVVIVSTKRRDPRISRPSTPPSRLARAPIMNAGIVLIIAASTLARAAGAQPVSCADPEDGSVASRFVRNTCTANAFDMAVHTIPDLVPKSAPSRPRASSSRVRRCRRTWRSRDAGRGTSSRAS